MKKLLLVFCINLVFSGLAAQQADLDASITKLKTAIDKVETAKLTYKQKFESISPLLVKYSLVESNDKGTKANRNYKFNLADVDANTVRDEVRGDLITIKLTVNKKAKLIELREENGEMSYVSELLIRASNPDNAKLLIKELKKSIPIARRITEERLVIDNYKEAFSLLKSSIRVVTIGENTIDQSIIEGQYPASLVLTKKEKGSKGENEEILEINLADLDVDKIDYEIKSDMIGVSFETIKRLKRIKNSQDGEHKGFASTSVIMTKDVAAARDLKEILEFAVSAAADIVKKSMSELNGNMQTTASYVKDVKYGDVVIDQKMNSDCLCTLELADQGSKNKKALKMKFNMIDINTNELKLEVASQKMFQSLLVVEKNKLIAIYENDVLTGFTDKAKIYVANSDIGKRLGYSLGESIKDCQKEFKLSFEKNIGSASSWLFDNVKEVKTDRVVYIESMKFDDEGNTDKVKFNKGISESKKSVEEVYEFDLSDINSKSVEYKFRSETLSVIMETKGKNKSIQFYKDGEIQNYATSVEIVVKDIETARNMIEALKYLIEENSK